MNRRELLMSGAILAAGPKLGLTQTSKSAGSAGSEPAGSPPKILLNDYLPKSIYRIPITNVPKAKYPLIDCHCHGRGPLKLDEMLKVMDKVGLEKAIIFTGAGTGDKFKEVSREYAAHQDRFDLWCMFDLRGVDEPGFGPGAIKSLEECHSAGAKGIGEITDKGRGIFSGQAVKRPVGMPAAFKGFNTASTEAPNYTPDPSPPNPDAPMGPHADDPRMDSLWERAGQLGMVISIHVADPIWSSLPMDNTNDGLMNGWSWRIDMQPGTYNNDQLVTSLENAMKKHPKTQFIACHLANLDYDLGRLGQMFDRNPNFYADIAARFAETATIPRVAAKFITKYADRIVYGSDVTYYEPFFATSFRILETDDDHFYFRGHAGGFLANANFNYHWTLNGFGLSDDVLKKIYHDNAMQIYARAQQNRT
jgi:predicted TIM-barrel fold metal-dependent hydrolase